MILFWDKNLPKTIPEALRRVKPPIGFEIYLENFPLSDKYPEGGDDPWLAKVGLRGWIVITQDWHMHKRVNELFAIKQHGMGVFYLWGSEEPKWEIMKCFIRGYDRMIKAIDTTPRPFIYEVSRTGILSSVALPKLLTHGEILAYSDLQRVELKDAKAEEQSINQ